MTDVNNLSLEEISQHLEVLIEALERHQVDICVAHLQAAKDRLDIEIVARSGLSVSPKLKD